MIIVLVGHLPILLRSLNPSLLFQETLDFEAWFREYRDPSITSGINSIKCWTVKRSGTDISVTYKTSM